MKQSRVRKKAKSRNRYNQASNRTLGTTWDSDKNTTRELRGQPFPAGDHMATMNRQENMANIKRKHK